MTEMLEPCPLCGSTNVTCFAEYDGDNWENVPVYHAVAACLGCHEEGCNPDYDEEPCFGIEAYYTQDHPLIRDLEDPEDCERALERYMAKRWNHRAQRTFHVVEMRRGISQMQTMVSKKCSECGYVFGSTEVRPLFSGLDEMIEIGNVDIPNYCPSCGARVVREAGEAHSAVPCCARSTRCVPMKARSGAGGGSGGARCAACR